MIHTPTPWQVCPSFTDNKHDGNFIVDATGLYVAGVWPGIRPLDQCDANAEFIARACNAHRALVDVLTRYVESDGRDDAGDDLQKAALEALTAARFGATTEEP